MSPAERKIHAAKILWLRKAKRRASWRQQHAIGLAEAGERYDDPMVRPSRQRGGEPAPVDLVFEARRQHGRLPKGCWA